MLRASTMHIGGVATQTWLRTRLVDAGHLRTDDFNRCFAVGRLTPGTNLLAFYTALGHLMSGMRGAVACLSVGAVAPTLIAVSLTVLYVQFSAVTGVSRLMAGAQAGAVAILFWTSAKLLVTTTAERLRPGALVALGALVAVWSGLPPVVILLAAAAAGAFVLGEQT
ncbi:MAG: chromate transporter [Vicinamibacterales bacterium]